MIGHKDIGGISINFLDASDLKLNPQYLLPEANSPFPKEDDGLRKLG
jgi:hypothetical protein